MKDMKPVAWAVNCDLGSGIKGIFECRERAMDFCHSVSKTHITPLYALPEGHVIVPVEPSEKMIEAWFDRLDKNGYNITGSDLSIIDAVQTYKDMLKAAQEEE